MSEVGFNVLLVSMGIKFNCIQSYFIYLCQVRGGRTVAQRPLVGVEVDAVLHIRIERLHLHVPK